MADLSSCNAGLGTVLGTATLLLSTGNNAILESGNIDLKGHSARLLCSYSLQVIHSCYCNLDTRALLFPYALKEASLEGRVWRGQVGLASSGATLLPVVPQTL